MVVEKLVGLCGPLENTGEKIQQSDKVEGGWLRKRDDVRIGDKSHQQWPQPLYPTPYVT